MKLINDTVAKIGPIDTKLEEKAQEHLDNLTKPKGSLGKLEWIAKKIVGITGNMNPSVKNKVIFTMASDHGVAEEGISAFPQEVTIQMVLNFINKGAAINVLAEHVGARVDVIDMGVNGDIFQKDDNFIVSKIGSGTKNFTKGPAMEKEQAIQAIEKGIEIFYKRNELGIDILGVGDMGIGNTTSSSAIIAAITDLPVESVVGRGTGIDDIRYRNKIKVIEKALQINKPNKKDPIDVLHKVGGFEIGGIAGAILAAAAARTPVIVDGFIATAGALIASLISHKVKPYLFASHKSKEAGHKTVLNYMQLEPILDLDLRLGEGTGAALAMGIVDASIKIFTNMATFSSAGVSTKIEESRT